MKQFDFKKILDYSRKFAFLKEGGKVVAAFSGGPDSVFLLHFLSEAKKIFNLEIFAVHVNHGARGAESDLDAEFCRKTADSLGIPFMLVRKNVPEYAKKERLSFEEAGRIVRLQAFKDALDYFKADVVATGHNADDQAETLLMRIVMGAGPSALCGIRPFYNNFLIRPLLELKKSEIVRYLEENGIEYRIDATNQDTGFFRNKVRNILLPFIKENFNPNADDALCRLASSSLESEEFLKNIVSPMEAGLIALKDGKAVLNIDSLPDKSPFFIKRMLVRAVEEVKGDSKNLTFHHIGNLFDLVFKPAGSSILIPGNLRAEKGYNTVIIEKAGVDETIPPHETDISFPGEYILEEWGLFIKGEIVENVPDDFSFGRFSARFDADSLGEGGFVLRTRRNGDRFRPFGLKGSKKLGDFFTDEKIPRHKRDLIPLLVKDARIIWIPGVRRSDLFRINEGTKRILLVKVENI